MKRILIAFGALLGVLGLVGSLLLGNGSADVARTTSAADGVAPRGPSAGAMAAPRGPVPPVGAPLRFQRLENPARTLVRWMPTGQVVATLTDGARTAVLVGTRRTFAEPRFTTATVESPIRVRLLPGPWKRGSERQAWFRRWLERELHSSASDALALAAGYLDGQPTVRNAAGIRIQGDASFGPDSDTSPYAREEASDFYDYLGVDWTFPDGKVARAEERRYGAVDCSGFVRLVYGYRMGMRLLNVNAAGPGLPRRAYALAGYAPGKVVVPNKLRQATSYDRLLPGDLVFFDLSGDVQIDHVGIYMGRDNAGHHRFVSSRGKANGPTFGDYGGTALLDDGGYYSRAFRTAKRL